MVDPLCQSGGFDPERDPDALWEWWTSVAMRQMLSEQSEAVRRAVPDGFVGLLRDAAVRPGASVESLARDVGLNRPVIEPWLKEVRRSRLRPFLAACIRLGASPAAVRVGLSRLFRGAVGSPWKTVSPAVPGSGLSPRHTWDARWVRAIPELDCLIAGGECRSVGEAERSLRLSHGTIERRDPECYATLWSSCAAWRERDRQLLRERAKQMLDWAIDRSGSRSAYAAARSLGVCSDTLEHWFPDRYRRLVAVRSERRAQACRTLLDVRCRAVRAAAYDLIRSGTHLSFPDVLSHAVLPPTLCRVPAVWTASETAFATLGLELLSPGGGSVPLCQTGVERSP